MNQPDPISRSLRAATGACTMAAHSEDRSSGWGDIEQLGRRHISTLPRYWITRLYVALSALTSILVSWLEPQALTHKLIDASGRQGWAVVAILAAICLVAIADVIVNDLLPDQFKMVATKRHRHLIYIALAMGIFCTSYVFVAGDGSRFRPLVLPFWLDGFIAAAVAFLDLFQRHRAPQ
jgi:hypothetical protein